MSESELVIARYEFPDSVEDVRRCAVGKKVLELYRVIQDRFDAENDTAVARVMDFHTDRNIYYIHPYSSQDIALGFISYDVDHEVNGAYVHHLAVDAKHRYKGIGTRLLHYIEDEAEQLGLDSVNLRAWETSPDFYLHRGYYRVDEQDNMMQLRLPRHMDIVA